MIAITGATGKTGSKIADILLSSGSDIRVIGRSADKLLPFRKNGADASVGDQDDASFLTRAFSGCRAVYLLIPPKMDTPDFREYYNRLADAAITAIKDSGVRKVVFLSSLGAELSHGTGPVVGLHDVEQKLRQLKGVDMVLLRPGYFMENTLWNIPLIQHAGINGNSTPPDAPFAVAATRDIAKKAAELLKTSLFSGVSIIDIFGDLISYREMTHQIGMAIGKPELPYVQFSEADALKGLMDSGLSHSMAASYVELSIALGNGSVHPTQTDTSHPTADTRFAVFAEEIFKAMYMKAMEPALV